MLWQLILKDLKVFFSDRRALLISMLVPIGIASFMAGIFGSAGRSPSDIQLSLSVVDQDGSDMSRRVVQNLTENPNLIVKVSTEAEAVGSVKTGKQAVAVILPKGFGEEAQGAMAGGNRPVVTLVTDPAQNVQV